MGRPNPRTLRRVFCVQTYCFSWTWESRKLIFLAILTFFKFWATFQQSFYNKYIAISKISKKSLWNPQILSILASDFNFNFNYTLHYLLSTLHCLLPIGKVLIVFNIYIYILIFSSTFLKCIAHKVIEIEIWNKLLSLAVSLLKKTPFL